jgi:hypothetical protein
MLKRLITTHRPTLNLGCGIVPAMHGGGVPLTRHQSWRGTTRHDATVAYCPRRHGSLGEVSGSL